MSLLQALQALFPSLIRYRCADGRTFGFSTSSSLGVYFFPSHPHISRPEYAAGVVTLSPSPHHTKEGHQGVERERPRFRTRWKSTKKEDTTYFAGLVCPSLATAEIVIAFQTREGKDKAVDDLLWVEGNGRCGKKIHNREGKCTVENG